MFTVPVTSVREQPNDSLTHVMDSATPLCLNKDSQVTPMANAPENALIVSRTKKSIDFFTEMLNAASMKPLAVLESAGEARRLLGERDIDLVIIDSPLRDEMGEDLAQHVASRDLSQVILVVSGEHLDAVAAVCEEDGVLVLSRPLNKSFFWSALKLAGATHRRLKRIQAENDKLKRQLEDIRIIHRAKCQLIFHHKISEQQAHRLIEKRAMDARTTRRIIAEGILKSCADNE